MAEEKKNAAARPAKIVLVVAAASTKAGKFSAPLRSLALVDSMEAAITTTPQPAAAATATAPASAPPRTRTPLPSIRPAIIDNNPTAPAAGAVPSSTKSTKKTAKVFRNPRSLPPGAVSLSPAPS
jgi:pyruvate/2-oxoglutarate dehydrogenase complex dihydrolipoamide acyltransferase (E2) component